jgi:AraC family transcriptional regulator of adaptative response/methylated-DNA-[protein]-cysteine methyltransferase
MDTPIAPSADPRLERARRLLDQQALGLDALGAAVGLSPGHLQRLFRQHFGLSPAEYLAQRRLVALKRGLRSGQPVTHALYEAGYGSPSRVYEDGAARLGMPPLAYGRGGEGLAIRWSLVDTVLGQALVAATERGICAVALGEQAEALERELRAEFPRASLQRVDSGRDDFLAPRLRAVAEALAHKSGTVPVEMVGTAFQLRVWQALMRIPPGETRSYAELAASLDAPKAARAVARACASNRVAVLVPCHRVIRGDGSPGGYRWGLPRKQALLAAEARASSATGKRRP